MFGGEDSSEKQGWKGSPALKCKIWLCDELPRLEKLFYAKGLPSLRRQRMYCNMNPFSWKYFKMVFAKSVMESKISDDVFPVLVHTTPSKQLENLCLFVLVDVEADITEQEVAQYMQEDAIEPLMTLAQEAELPTRNNKTAATEQVDAEPEPMANITDVFNKTFVNVSNMDCLGGWVVRVVMVEALRLLEESRVAGTPFKTDFYYEGFWDHLFAKKVGDVWISDFFDSRLKFDVFVTNHLKNKYHVRQMLEKSVLRCIATTDTDSGKQMMRSVFKFVDPIQWDNMVIELFYDSLPRREDMPVVLIYPGSEKPEYADQRRNCLQGTDVALNPLWRLFYLKGILCPELLGRTQLVREKYVEYKMNMLGWIKEEVDEEDESDTQYWIRSEENEEQESHVTRMMRLINRYSSRTILACDVKKKHMSAGRRRARAVP
jgi:hypothetical protein